MFPPTMTRQSIARLNETTTIVTRDYSPYSCHPRSFRLESGVVSASAAAIAEAELARVGARVVARVTESTNATDLALALSSARLAVVRCVEQATPEDHTALATMVDERDFVWAGLVYRGQLPAGAPGYVEAFHLSELPRLIDRLEQLRDPEAP